MRATLPRRGPAGAPPPVRAGGIIRRAMFAFADLLGLGHSYSSFGDTLALIITFLGIGVIANVLIVYAVIQVMAERRQNQERIAAYDRGETAHH